MTLDPGPTRRFGGSSGSKVHARGGERENDIDDLYLGSGRTLPLTKAMEPVSLPMELFRAGKCGDLATLKHLVEEVRIDPSSRDAHGRTPLHWAAHKGHLETVKYLVEKRDCDVICRDKYGNTALDGATLGGKLNTVQYLISERGCDPTCRGRYGRTALHHACEGGYLDVVKYLINDQKVDPSCRDINGATPLHITAEFGSLEVVKYLVEEKGCDVMCRNMSGDTPLHMAAAAGKLNTVQYLISEQGCDPTCRGQQGRPPLHHACYYGNLDVARYLIDHQKVDSSCQDENGDTPLHTACIAGQLSAVRLLVEDNLVDPGLRNRIGKTPLDTALQKGQAHIASYLSYTQTIVSTDLRRALVARLKPYIRKAHPTGRELGSGTYGSVIELESAGEVVAGKVFKTISGTRMQKVLDSLCGEMIVMIQIHHPNIVESKGVCFLVNHPLPVLLMERLMSSLHAYLLDPSHHAVELTSKVSILCDVASGLSYLHSHTPAIIHRDVTAKNVLLDSNLKAKIGDFGNARLMDLDPECSPETFTSLPGTLEYMPPEAQGKHAKYDPSLDVFSFGHLALFTIIQSRVSLLLPTYSDSEGIHARSEVKRRDNSIKAAEQMLGANHSLVVLIKRCLHNSPAQRPRTDQIVSRMQQVTSEEGSNTSPKERALEQNRTRLNEGGCVSDMKLSSCSQELDTTPHPVLADASKRQCTTQHPLDSKPTIKQLLILQTKSGLNIDIKTALAADWKEFGFYFDFDQDGSFLNLIETECGKHKPVACYQEMMRKWMTGHGEQPANWRTLVKLLREFEKNTLAQDIEDALSFN